MRPIAAILLTFCLSACSPPRQTVSIEFEARLGNEPIDCETVVDGVAMTDLRFFVTGPILLFTEDPEAEPDGVRFLSISQDGRWQQEGLVLIDLENGRGACVNGTADSNSTLKGVIPEGDYSGLSFQVAVPFARNHADPLAAAPPLDDSTMHWHWRSGYKFMRVGFETDDDGFWMHVGSAGCEGTVGNITGCRFPNWTYVSVEDYRPGDKVIFDFAPLIESIDVVDGRSTDCSSGPSEEACREPFRALGLDFDTGEALIPMPQSTLFRAESS